MSESQREELIGCLTANPTAGDLIPGTGGIRKLRWRSAIRSKLGITRQAFAARFGFSINTLRHWEQGKREPEGPTRAYLIVIDRAPHAVQKALRIA